MTSRLRTVIYPVKNLGQAKKLYAKLLGVAPYMDEAYYVGFRVGDQEVGLDPHGHSKGTAGPVGYWHVADIKRSLKQLLEAGAETQQAVQDVGGGKLVASVKRRGRQRHRTHPVTLIAVRQYSLSTLAR